MASLPYITAPGNIDRALNGIKAAAVPPRVSQDFVKTILKIPGGSGDQVTAFLKKLGFANPDGSPNEAYRRFRNPTTSERTMAAAIKKAYAPLAVRNEFFFKLNDNDLLGLVVEETGGAHDANPVKLIVNCIKHLKEFADFTEGDEETGRSETRREETEVVLANALSREGDRQQKNLGINLGYTINLNLPATSDPAVFDAIFKSLKEHLLRDSDG